MFNNLHQTLPHARAGKLRTRAVTSDQSSLIGTKDSESARKPPVRFQVS